MTESKLTVLLRDFGFTLRKKGKLFESWTRKYRGSTPRRTAWAHSPQGLADAMCPLVRDDEFTSRAITR